MYDILIEALIGLSCGLLFGTTGILPLGIIIILLDILKISDYKTIMGSVLFLSLFPSSIGAVYNFYKDKKIDYVMGIVLLISIMTGSFIGSKLVVGKDSKLSVKTIKYITGYLSLLVAIVFLISAYYEKN
jgi:uncharacterized membrane protein YfcA